MNIKTQCCGLVIMLIFLIFYYSRPHLKLATSKVFQIMMWGVLLCISFDIISIMSIVYNKYLPDIFITFICKTYLVLLVVCCFLGLSYLWAGIYKQKRAIQVVINTYVAILILNTVLIYALPIQYINIPTLGIIYTYGPSTIATYIGAIFMILSLAVNLIINHNRLEKRKHLAIIIWIFIWIAATSIQFMNNRLLLVGFAECLGVLIIYIMLENPEKNIDINSGFFNSTAFVQYITDIYNHNKDFSITYFHGPWKKEIFANLPKNIDIFRDSYEGIILATKQLGSLSDFQYFKETIEKKITADNDENKWIFIPDGNIVKSTEELLNLLGYFKHNTVYSNENVIVVDEALNNELIAFKNTEKMISSAMEEDRIEVFYQPIYSTARHKYCSAEALVRIRDTDGKIIPPGVFIPVAEKNKMIIELGRIVLEKVCLFLSKHSIEKLGLDYIEVNLSVIQGADVGLAANVKDILNRYQIDPSWINLEITESASLQGKQNLLKSMAILKEDGVSFSLDDFGTGQSNLNYIAEMPIDIVKFDRGMTQAYFTSKKVKLIMDAAIQMIHELKLSIVSEGIETKEQYDVMEQLGISYIQGYYFSKPVPENEFLQLLASN